jgi:hypothetical protein
VRQTFGRLATATSVPTRHSPASSTRRPSAACRDR